MTVETARIPGTTGDGAVQRPPFGGKRRLADVVSVRLPGARTRVRCDVGRLTVAPGAALVVQTSDGDVVAEAVGLVERTILNEREGVRALRLATDEDLADWESCQRASEDAVRSALRASKRIRLDVKIVAAHVPLSGNKTVIFYSAEQRQDVRKLARELSSVLRGRVDLRSIGIREGAAAIGGLGPCGHELCCSSFLTRFSSVSLRFAKDQGLSLNPQRVTGMCGRLKCCLVYEQPTYKEMKRYAPRRKNGAYTPSGAGNILDVDVLNRRVLVRLSGGAMETFHIRDVTLVDRPLTPQEIEAGGPSREQKILDARKRRRGDSTGKLSNQASTVLSEDYIWDDTEGKAAISESSPDEAPKKKRRRRKKKPSGGGQKPAQSQRSAKSGGGNQNAAAGQKSSGGQKADGGGASGDGAPKKRRRRRGGRRRSGGNSGGGNSGGGNSGGGNSGGGNSGGA